MVFKEEISMVKVQTITLMTAAFGFVAALFWKDAISSMINTYIPQGETWPYMVFSALIVTVIAVIVIILVTKYIGKVEK